MAAAGRGRPSGPAGGGHLLPRDERRDFSSRRCGFGMLRSPAESQLRAVGLSGCRPVLAQSRQRASLRPDALRAQSTAVLLRPQPSLSLCASALGLPVCFSWCHVQRPRTWSRLSNELVGMWVVPGLELAASHRRSRCSSVEPRRLAPLGSTRFVLLAAGRKALRRRRHGEGGLSRRQSWGSNPGFPDGCPPAPALRRGVLV